jgi:hypothetical protein
VTGKAYHSAFDVSQNDHSANKLLRQQFGNLPLHVISEFAERTKTFLLQDQFKILIERYSEQFFDLVNFANKHCQIRFENDVSVQDLIDPILRTYDN